MSVAGEIRSWTLRRSGAHRRRLTRAPFPGVAVLVYHGVRGDLVPRHAMQGRELHVSAARLAEQCRTIRELCTPISGEDFVAAATDQRPLPPNAVMFTFDDGYASMLRLALPVLERFQIPAVVFVCPDPVARGVRFWFDAVAERCGVDTVTAMKALPYEAWIEASRRHEMASPEGDPHRPLTVDELRRLAASPLIEIGAHTMTHPILANASLDRQRDEIVQSQRVLAGWVGTAPRLFAYPNGRPGLDYSADTVAIVREVFAEGFAVGDTFTEPGRYPGEQRRLTMLDSVSGAELGHRLAVSWPRASGAR
ncbi:MAG: polysaccharide deacetylase family protein [Vicinamibacterales bacterium]|nr:polysaccharide deacetylase family protein [Vicinamibacterales bacterium]